MEKYNKNNPPIGHWCDDGYNQSNHKTEKDNPQNADCPNQINNKQTKSLLFTAIVTLPAASIHLCSPHSAFVLTGIKLFIAAISANLCNAFGETLVLIRS